VVAQLSIAQLYESTFYCKRTQMDKRKEKKYLSEWGFKSRSKYEKFIKGTIEDLEFIAPQVFKIFKDKVIEWEQDFFKDKGERFFAETISPPNEKLVKSPERVIEKILESWKDYDQWKAIPKGQRGQEPIRHDHKDFIHTMNDLIRFRVVCNYLDDVKYIGKKFWNFAKKCKGIELVDCIDSIETPYPERRAGHRALQFIFKYLSNKDPIRFEVQVMTQLQHAWDKKDHHLIYEYVRIKKGDKIPVHLKNRMAAMSEVLYVADNVFDSLLTEITKIMEKNRI